MEWKSIESGAQDVRIVGDMRGLLSKSRYWTTAGVSRLTFLCFKSSVLVFFTPGFRRI